MRIKIILLFILGLINSNLNSQGLNNIYLFGYTGPYRGTIDMYNGTPVVITDSVRITNLSLTHANISDKNGNLLFYTNGAAVFDRNHSLMLNGGGLNPCQYTTNFAFGGLVNWQGDIIIPFPHDTNRYYLFHQAFEYLSIYSSSQIYYSIINMLSNNGLGDVISKNNSFFQDTLTGTMLSACKHANGRDWWFVVPKDYSSIYHIFLITPNGVQFISTQNIGQRYYSGQAFFSADGNHWGYYDHVDGMDILNFDRCTGTFSNWRHEAVSSTWGLGFCFSPDSKLAYAASSYALYQYNLDSSNLASSKQLVATWDSTYSPNPPFETGFQFMQIGPDGKIYMTTTSTTYRMHCINYPDSLGIACDMQQHSLILPTYNDNTIPNFPNYFLGPVIGSICDSLGLGITETIYDKNLNLRINPNPAQGSFYVNYELPTGKDAVLYVYNTMGQEVYRQPIYSNNKYLQVHCDAWRAGVYLVKIKMKHDGFTVSGKVVVF